MVKEKFYTLKQINSGNVATKECGYIDKACGVGYYKSTYGWYAIDLKSGMSITYEISLKDARGYVELYTDKIEKIRSSPHYMELCEMFREKTEEAMKGE